MHSSFHTTYIRHGGDRKTFEVMTSTKPRGIRGSVASVLTATLYQGYPDMSHTIWNIVWTEKYILHIQVLLDSDYPFGIFKLLFYIDRLLFRWLVLFRDSCQWNTCSFEISWLGHENTIFYLIRTKQCCCYINPFHECILFYGGLTVASQRLHICSLAWRYAI